MMKIEQVAYNIFLPREHGKILVDYDCLEDVLYVNYLNSEPREADYAKRFGDYIIRFKDKKIIGVTVINAMAHFKINFEDSPSIIREKRLVYA